MKAIYNLNMFDTQLLKHLKGDISNGCNIQIFLDRTQLWHIRRVGQVLGLSDTGMGCTMVCPYFIVVNQLISFEHQIDHHKRRCKSDINLSL